MHTSHPGGWLRRLFGQRKPRSQTATKLLFGDQAERPAMPREYFENRLMKCHTLGKLGSLSQDYCSGYKRGLRRRFHGESFGTDSEHQQWLHLGLDGDPRHDVGQGYRDGFAGREPRL
jgi:hypothetical protein